ncbi:MAG: hypothetical protein LC670_10220 [Flavobacteriales bacterium]|nr:hypothetical protein [Flavobacteriales bacterium]
MKPKLGAYFALASVGFGEEEYNSICAAPFSTPTQALKARHISARGRTLSAAEIQPRVSGIYVALRPTVTSAMARHAFGRTAP